MGKSAAKSAAPVAKDGTRRGGARPGAGRKPKPKTEPTSIAEIDLRALLDEPAPDEIDAKAQQELGANINALVRIVVHGASETARITCCKEILDRGYGKPAVEIGGDAASPMLPLMMAPSVAPSPGIGVTAAFRAEARKYANLAIEVLRRIRDYGKSETARAAAAKALNERGLGMVAPARVPETDTAPRELGIKEQRQRAAEAAARGKFATPPAPQRETLQ